MITREIERRNEKFLVAVSDNGKQTSVTDTIGTKVTISYDSGNLNVRLPNGWGSWKPSMESAVDYAAKLCIDTRGQLTPGEAYKQMEDFVKDEDDKE